MLDLLFPKRIDNIYRGQWLGLGLFVLFLLVKLLQSVNSILNTRDIMIGADGIPLDSYDADAAQMAVVLFVLLSWGQLILALIGLLLLVRYRAMIPLMFVIFLIEHLGRRVLLMLNPTERVADGAPIGFYVNLGMAAVLLLGLLLSVWRRRNAKEAA